MAETVFPPFIVTATAIRQLELMGGHARVDVQQGAVAETPTCSPRESIGNRIAQRGPYLASQDPRIVAHDEAGEVVGMAGAGPARDTDMTGIPELYMMYTLSRTYGSGLGSQLLRAAIGDTPAYLWVLEESHPARAFYQKSGFNPDPGESEDYGIIWTDPRALTDFGVREPTEPWAWTGPRTVVEGRSWGGCLEVIDQIAMADRVPEVEELEEAVLLFETREELPPVYSLPGRQSVVWAPLFRQRTSEPGYARNMARQSPSM